MRSLGVRWLWLLLAVGAFPACGSDSDEAPGAPGASKGGEAGETGEAGSSGVTGAAAAAGEASAGAGSGGETSGEPSGGAAGNAGQGGAGEVGEVLIATAQDAPTGIALDDDNVYWANRDAGTIVSCPLSGCNGDSPTELVADQEGVLGIAVDATSIYFMSGRDADNLSHVGKCPIDGCTGDPEVLLELSANRANDVHVDGDRFYYGAWPQFGWCPTDGCGEDGRVDFGGYPVVSIDTDADHLYSARYGLGAIHRCDLPDCTSDTLLVSGVVPLSVAVDDAFLYFASYDTFEFFPSADPAEILKCPLDGCGEDDPEVVVSEDVSPFAIAVNESRLFFTNVEHGTVVSIPK
jgi:hypothetical protein